MLLGITAHVNGIITCQLQSLKISGCCNYKHKTLPICHGCRGRTLTGEGENMQAEMLHLSLHSTSLPPQKETQGAILHKLSTKQHGLMLPSSDCLTSNHGLGLSPSAMLHSYQASSGEVQTKDW